MRTWIVVACLAVALSACGGGGGGTKQPAVGAGSTFSGTLSDGALLKATLTDPAALRSAEVAVATWPLNITGTITPSGGAPIDITGGFDPDGGTFMLGGGGYSISGSFASNAMTATGTGPEGTVTLIAYRSDDVTVVVYCGTWQDTAGGTDSGTFNMIVRGTAIYVVASDGRTFTATLSGTSFTLQGPQADIYPTSGTITGTGPTSTVAGTSTGCGSTPCGTFSGSFCQ